MEYTGRYWKKTINSEERRGPFKFSIKAESDEKAVNAAKTFVMCNLESTTAVVIESPQLRVGDQWINLD